MSNSSQERAMYYRKARAMVKKFILLRPHRVIAPGDITPHINGVIQVDDMIMSVKAQVNPKAPKWFHDMYNALCIEQANQRDPNMYTLQRAQVHAANVIAHHLAQKLEERDGQQLVLPF